MHDNLKPDNDVVIAHARRGAGAAAAYLATRPQTFQARSEAAIRENPEVSVLAALLVGFVLGRLVSR